MSMLSFFNISNLFLIELIFICPIKTIKTAFFKTSKLPISPSSFSELCGVIFVKFFSASLIGLESKVLLGHPNGCQNFLIVATKLIASLATPYVSKYKPLFPKFFLIIFLLFIIGIFIYFKNSLTSLTTDPHFLSSTRIVRVEIWVQIPYSFCCYLLQSFLKLKFFAKLCLGYS